MKPRLLWTDTTRGQSCAAVTVRVKAPCRCKWGTKYVIHPSIHSFCTPQSIHGIAWGREPGYTLDMSKVCNDKLNSDLNWVDTVFILIWRLVSSFGYACIHIDLISSKLQSSSQKKMKKERRRRNERISCSTHPGLWAAVTLYEDATL